MERITFAVKMTGKLNAELSRTASMLFGSKAIDQLDDGNTSRHHDNTTFSRIKLGNCASVVRTAGMRSINWSWMDEWLPHT